MASDPNIIMVGGILISAVALGTGCFFWTTLLGEGLRRSFKRPCRIRAPQAHLTYRRAGLIKIYIFKSLLQTKASSAYQYRHRA